jgi:hypothetical protein
MKQKKFDFGAAAPTKLKSSGGPSSFMDKAPDKKRQKFSQVLKSKMKSSAGASGMTKLMKGF